MAYRSCHGQWHLFVVATHAGKRILVTSWYMFHNIVDVFHMFWLHDDIRHDIIMIYIYYLYYILLVSCTYHISYLSRDSVFLVNMKKKLVTPYSASVVHGGGAESPSMYVTNMDPSMRMYTPEFMKKGPLVGWVIYGMYRDYNKPL